MITLYNLENSRSQRVAWLLEELNVPYEVQEFKRDPVTKLAPQSMRAIHPLGKAPIIRDGDAVIAESGAIFEYILNHYGNGRLRPAADSAAYTDYLQWMHYAEGSAMTAFLLALLGGGERKLFFDAQFDLHMGYIESRLEGKKWLLGDELSAADILMSFPLQFAMLVKKAEDYPNVARFVAQVESHPSYRKACERVGELHLEKLG